MNPVTLEAGETLRLQSCQRLKTVTPRSSCRGGMASPPTVLSDDLSPTCELMPLNPTSKSLLAAQLQPGIRGQMRQPKAKPLAGEGPGGGIQPHVPKWMWGCHGSGPTLEGSLPPWADEPLGTCPLLLEAVLGWCPLGWCVALSSNPSLGLCLGFFEAAYQLS